MEIKKIMHFIWCIVLLLITFSCEELEDTDADYGPDSIRDVTIKYVPDSGTSSVSYFYTTYNNDFSCSGYNNETSYPGVVWSYDGGTTISLSYSDGGSETITFTSETRYKYTGTTASGYSESHVGTWQLISANGDDSDDETTSSDARIVFWISKDFGDGNIKVTFNGTSKYISKYYSSSPDYGTSGCASFTVDPGTYSWKAQSNTYSWSGTTTLDANELLKMQLTD